MRRKLKMKYTVSAIALAATMTIAMDAVQAAELKAEVMHWMVSAGESAAIREVAKAFEARGGIWQDNAIAGGEIAVPAIVSRIVGGNPPTVSEMMLGKQIDDFVSQGLLAPIDEEAKQTGFLENIPEAFQKAAVYPDGHMYALPINDHGQNWIWYNKQVLADAGAKEPVTWGDMFAALDAIKAKGNAIPVAVGAQPWQLGQTFLSVLLTKEGSDFYYKIFRDLDTDAVKSEVFKDAVNTFLKLRDYADPGSANREWNVAANMVITGKAGFQFMGDWVKGELVAAGITPGKEIGCQILGNGDGKQYFNVTSDAFIFPVNKDPDQIKAQKLLAEVMMSKDVQIAFNARKGSVPARLDVDMDKLDDACSKLGVNILQKPEQRVSGFDFIMSSDMIGAERDLAAQAWANTSMDAAKFTDAFLRIIETEKSTR